MLPHTNTGVGPAPGDRNESPTPQRDPKVMGKVRLTTEVLFQRNLEYPHTTRVGEIVGSSKGAVDFLKNFEKIYMEFFRHSFFSPKSKWRCSKI